MEKSRLDYSKYRIEKAEKELRIAKSLFNDEEFEASTNRSYYAIFHALRSVTVLDGFESRKHSGIISYFNLHYIKTEIFQRDMYLMIDSAFTVRNKTDYEDFYVISPEETQRQIHDAEKILGMIKSYLKIRWEEDQN